MSDATAARPRIADIIRDSGKMGGDASGASQDQLAAVAAAISGAPAGTILASEAIANELAQRFPKLASKTSVERNLEAAYETGGRALILALQACGYVINAAFDTSSGAVLETKKPVSLLAPPFVVILTLTDGGAQTHLAGTAQHTGVDWGQNAKLLNALFDKANEYLALFKS
jgi:hypothetical protein